VLVGDSNRFAIESEISRAYARPSLRGLGFFVIHLSGMLYGVKAVDATLLACSFDEVTNRLQRRGRHKVFFSNEIDAGKLANAIAKNIYAPDDIVSDSLGLSRAEFENLIHSTNIVWAPDGDQAFDDGSLVLQFDVGDRVRLIGFRRRTDFCHDPATLRDIWLGAHEFYDILSQWSSKFEAEWIATPKATEG
jgi:hypothetical protein